eukprot:scaffold112284_cov20-Cyclotella_meneghiniana.AAC.1
MKRLHMLVEHLLGNSKYEEMIKNGFINPLSLYPENVEVFLPVVSAVKSECSSDLSKSSSTSSTPTDVAVKALATMFDSDIGFFVPGITRPIVIMFTQAGFPVRSGELMSTNHEPELDKLIKVNSTPTKVASISYQQAKTNRTKLAPVSAKSNRLLTAFDAFFEK